MGTGITLLKGDLNSEQITNRYNTSFSNNITIDFDSNLNIAALIIHTQIRISHARQPTY